MGAMTAQVVSVNGAARTAVVVGLPEPVPVLRHVAGVVAGGDLALVVREGGQAWLVGVLGAAPVPVPEPGEDPRPPAPPSTSAPVTRTFRPTWSGSWRAGAWRGDTSDLFQGDYTGRGVQSGACWWGRLPSGILSGRVQLIRASGAGAGAAQAPTMTLLAGTTRPSGASTVRASTPGPSMPRTGGGSSVSWPIPPAWIAQLNAGTAGGIGITSGGSASPYLGLVVSGGGMTLSVTVEG